jgi:ABC-type transport system involved in cytochrome c biogenesis permease subunit
MLTFIAKAATSLMAFPGAMMVARGLGRGELFPMPAEMRFDEKLAAVSPRFIPAEHLMTFVLAAGVAKILVFLNNWVFRSKSIATLLFLASIPGFALVAFAHDAIGQTAPADVAPCVVMPVLLMILSSSGFGGGAKAKRN